MKLTTTLLLLVGLAGATHAETLSGLCMISVSHNKDANVEVLLRRSDCGDDHGNCGVSNNSSLPWNRWTGVSPEALKQEGATLSARMNGEAGALTCDGTVHDGVLAGRYKFTPDAAFIQKMTSMGFDGITARKAEGFLMLDVTSAWVQQMKDAGVAELSTDKLMGLRALRVDPTYVRGMAAAGYPELRANKLIEMKAVGVTPEKAADARALGFQPTTQELIQMSIFKIDSSFRGTDARGGLQGLDC